MSWLRKLYMKICCGICKAVVKIKPIGEYLRKRNYPLCPFKDFECELKRKAKQMKHN